MLARIDPDAVLVLGDSQYKEGELSDFESSYDPTWGRFADRTFPAPGNHEYRTEGASGYFAYFGERAHGDRGGWYSFDLGAWHLVAVNSGSGTISAEQLEWIEEDLAADEGRCELAYWHHPRWTSGTIHGSDPEPGLDPLWNVLHDAGVDVVLNGHEHNYERFAPLNSGGESDPDRGIRQFVVGTGGGGSFHPFGAPRPGSERRIVDTYGVLELTLHERGYAWRFVSVDDRVLDEGRGTCHP